MPATLQLSVPVAVPDTPLELDHVTLAVPVSSDDVPLKLILSDSVP